MKQFPSVYKFVLAAITLGFFAILFWNIGSSWDSEPYVSEKAPVIDGVVARDKALRLSITGTGDIDGIDFYSSDTRIEHVNFEALIYDSRGRLLSRSFQQKLFYANNDTHTATIRLLVKPVTLKSKPSYLDLRVINRESATVRMNGDSEQRELIFSVLRRLPASFEQRQGVLAGLAFGLALLLLNLVSKYLPSKHIWILGALSLAGLAVLTCLPFLYRQGWGIDDWDYRYSLGHIYRMTLLQFGQLPAWNPYICGGSAGLGDPEFALFSPYFALQILLGVANGTGWALVFGFIITGLGAMFLAHRLKFAIFPSLAAGLIVMLNSSLFLKAAEGHTTIIFAFMWIPWALAAWVSAYRSESRTSNLWTLLCGLFLTLSLLQGGIYILSYTALAFAGLIILAPQHKRAFRISLIAGIFMMALGAFQLVPTLLWLRQFQAHHFVGSAYTWNKLIDIFFGRHMQGANPIRDQLSKWHEYGAYIGYTSLLLLLPGLSYIKSKRTIRILLIGGITALIFSALGPMLEPVLSALPLLPRSNVSRLVMFVILCVALIASYGVMKFRALMGNKSYLPILLIGLMAIDLASLAYPIAAQGFVVSPNIVSKAAAWPIEYLNEDFTARVNGMDTPRSYGAVLKGYGTYSFCTSIGPKASVQSISPDHPHPPYVSASQGVSASLVSWTPNLMVLNYSSEAPADIVLNSNFARGWRASVGKTHSANGRLAMNVPAGQQRKLTVEYKTPGLLMGTIISVIGAILALYLVWSSMFTKKPKQQKK